MHRFAAIILAVAIFSSACGGVSPDVTAHPSGSEQPLDLTLESSPTHNPQPTATQAASATPSASPTETAIPSPTPTPDPRIMVALTIDDGWIKGAFDTMLDLLAEHNVRATFFLILRAANQLGPDRMQRLAAEGHEIGYHSCNHGVLDELMLWGVSEWSADYELWAEGMRALLGDQAFDQAVYPFARAPYGLFNAAFLAMTEEKGLVPISWSVDMSVGANRIRFRDGDILMLHVSSPDALTLADILAREGIHIGALSEFLPADPAGGLLKTIPLE